METEIIVTEEEKLKQLALSDLARAKALQVVDNESYRDCCMLELQIKEGIKEAEKKLEPVVDSTRKAWKAALKLLADIVEPRNQALEYVQSLRVGYEQRQKGKAKEEQKRKTEDAIAKAKEDANNVAKILEESGEKELAEQVRTNISAPVINVEVDLPKIKNIATEEKWFFKVIDESRVNRSYMTIDERKIQGIVNAQHRDAMQIIGGIEVWSEDAPRGAAKK